MRTATKLLSLLLILWTARPAPAWAEIEDSNGLKMRRSTSNGSTETIEYYNVVGYEARPASEDLKRLEVEWGKVEPGPYRGMLSVSGKLLLRSADGKSTRPVDWFQGVRVLIARQPNARPDWTDGQDGKETAWHDRVVTKTGEFTATYRDEMLRRVVGQTAPFQVGVSLATGAKDDPFTLTWDVDEPVVPGSLSNIEIAGPEELSPTLQIINAATPWGRNNFNPAALVRAVNLLQRMEKKEAIDTLVEYLAGSTDIWSWEGETDPANIDTGDRDGVFWIIRLLFEPANAGDRLPTPYNYVLTIDDDDPDAPLWPFLPLALQGEVPFVIHGNIGGTGMPEDPVSHLQWAYDHGVIRSKPLRPADDPLAAADELTSLPGTRRFLSPTSDELRWQAYRAVKHLIPDVTLQKEQFKPIPAEQWQAVREAFAKRNIRWDEERQEYAARDPAAEE